MQEFQSIYKETNPDAPGLFDMPQEAHVMHRKDSHLLEVAAEDEEEYDPGADPMFVLDIDEILEKLTTKMFKDADFYEEFGNPLTHLLQKPDDVKVNCSLKSLHEVVVPACVRCNTLMTMTAAGNRVLAGMGILRRKWYRLAHMQADDEQVDQDAAEQQEDDADAGGAGGGGGAGGADADPNADPNDHPQAVNVPKEALRALIRQSVNRVRAQQNGDAWEQRTKLSRMQLTMIMHAFYYVLCANLTRERVGRDRIPPHDLFRALGVQRVYTSFFWYVLLTVRFPGMFQTGFTTWHIHYAENYALNDAFSMHWLVYRNHRFIPDNTTPRSITQNDVQAVLVRRTVEGIMRSLNNPLHARVQVNGVDAQRWNRPSIWTMGYVAMAEYRAKNYLFSDVNDNDWGHPEHRKYMPTPEYCKHMEGLANMVVTLNIDQWVLVCHARLVFRRMFATTQFCLDPRLVDFMAGMFQNMAAVNPVAPGAEQAQIRMRNYMKFVTDYHTYQHVRMRNLNLEDYVLVMGDDVGNENVLDDLREDYVIETQRLVGNEVAAAQNYAIQDAVGRGRGAAQRGRGAAQRGRGAAQRGRGGAQPGAGPLGRGRGRGGNNAPGGVGDVPPP